MKTTLQIFFKNGTSIVIRHINYWGYDVNGLYYDNDCEYNTIPMNKINNVRVCK